MIKLIPATIKDCYFWWKVRNDESVREFSFNSDYISYSTHKKWFEAKLKDEKTRLLIIRIKGKKVGQLRLEKNDSEIEMSIALTPFARGKSLGTEAIKLGTNFAIDKLNAKKVMAYTKPENIASITAFKKAGFVISEKLIYKGNKAVALGLNE